MNCVVCGEPFIRTTLTIRAKTCSPKCSMQNDKTVAHESYLRRKAKHKQFLQLRGLA